MADVRALLRQQRAARRIEHPHAAYTDAGKLVCVLCREHVKTEALWDGHIRNTGHRQRLQALQQQQQSQSETQGEESNEHKRKLDAQEDDEATSPISTDETDRASKRTRPNTLSPEPRPAPPISNPEAPALTQQKSFTPTAGIELAIPSRPATPADATTTPKSAGGPLRPFSQLSEQQHSHPPTSQPTSTSTPAPAPVSTSADAPQAPQEAQVDDDLWASFEADLLAPPSNSAPSNPFAAAGDAVIAAAPVSAAEAAAAAKSYDEEQSLRQSAKDHELEDEREEATRALETEFEIMEELEARARRLRERREALRAGLKVGGSTQSGTGQEDEGMGVEAETTAKPVGDKSVADGAESAAKTSAAAAVLAALGKENSVRTTKGKVVDEEEDGDEDDEDDEEDDWDGFRFRA
ncbi:hypothetical protein B0T09DRAFT_20945 [Sordaria sp. MPI-SDFR-AT-0083]|nr:hypothetical protein B0T09DRAFT_20945 [Sordaria sp. MPI-SDFR-AT-0083]